MTTTISPARAREIMADALLLDVRTPAEFTESHIAGSVLHPLAELSPAEVQKLAAGRKATIIVCRSGKRAGQAAETLAAASLPALAVLEGGVLAWDAAGLPLERGRKTISLERQVRIGAGALVFIGSALAWFVSPAWLALPAFVGTGLVFAGITDFCGMGLLIARLPWNNRR